MNYYEILNVSKTSTEKEIKKSYKQLVKKYHPDVFVGDKATANKKIQELNEAYETLSNSKLRQNYDEALAMADDFKFSSSITTEASVRNEPSPQQKYEDLYRYDYYKKYTTNYYGVSRDDLKTAKEKAYENNFKDSETIISSSSHFKLMCILAIVTIILLLLLMISLSYLRTFFDTTTSTLNISNASLPTIDFGMSFVEVEELLGTPDSISEKHGKTYIYWGNSYIIFDNNEKVIGWHNSDNLFYTETVDGEDFTELQEFYNAIYKGF